MSPRLCCAAALLLAACGGEAPEPEPEQAPVVHTTFWPTTWMARQIAGDALPVVCPLPEGVDPHAWRPARETLVAYQGAALIVMNGADYERWARMVSLPASRILDTTRGLKEQFITFDTLTHSHGGGPPHTHEGIDPHVWMDPVLAKAQLRAIHAAFVTRFPAYQETFDAGWLAASEALEAVDAAWKRLAPELAAARVHSNHQAYAYPARRYGFTVTDLDLDPASELGANALFRLRELPPPDARRRILLWTAPPLETLKRRLADEFGFVSVVVPTLEAEPTDGERDFARAMLDALDRLGLALRGE